MVFSAKIPATPKGVAGGFSPLRIRLPGGWIPVGSIRVNGRDCITANTHGKCVAGNVHGLVVEFEIGSETSQLRASDRIEVPVEWCGPAAGSEMLRHYNTKCAALWWREFGWIAHLVGEFAEIALDAEIAILNSKAGKPTA